MASIGSLNLKLVANPRNFFTALDKVEAKVKQWSNKVEGAVSAATRPFRMATAAITHVGEKASGLVGMITNPLGAIEDAFSGFFDSILSEDSAFGQIDMIARSAEKLDAPVEKLSALTSVANRNRIETEDFIDVLFSLSQAVGEVAIEIDEESTAFGKLSGHLKRNALLARFAEQQNSDLGKSLREARGGFKEFSKIPVLESNLDISFAVNGVGERLQEALKGERIKPVELLGKVDFGKGFEEAHEEFKSFGKTVAKIGKLESKLDLSFAMNDVAKQAAGARAAFERLGINALEFSRLDVTQQVSKLVDVLGEVENAQQRLANASLIFGEDDAKKFLELVRLGGTELKKQIKEAKELGLTFNLEEAQKVQRAQDSVRRLKLSFEGVKRQVAIALAPVFERISTKIVDAIKTFDARKIAKVIAKVVTSVIEFGSTLVRVLGSIASTLADIAKGLGKAVDAGISGSSVDLAVKTMSKGFGATFGAMASNGLASQKNTVDPVGSTIKKLGDEIQQILKPPDDSGFVGWLKRVAEEQKKVQEVIGKFASSIQQQINTIRIPAELRQLNELANKGVPLQELKKAFALQVKLATTQKEQELKLLQFSPEILERMKFRQIAKTIGLTSAAVRELENAVEKLGTAKGLQKLKAEAEGLNQQFRRPTEKLNDRIGKLVELFKSGQLDVRAFEGAMREAGRAFQSSQFTAPRPAAIEKGSLESFAIINARDGEQADGFKKIEEIIKRELDVLRQIKTAQEAGNRALQAMQLDLRENTRALTGGP